MQLSFQLCLRRVNFHSILHADFIFDSYKFGPISFSVSFDHAMVNFTWALKPLYLLTYQKELLGEVAGQLIRTGLAFPKHCETNPFRNNQGLGALNIEPVIWGGMECTCNTPFQKKYISRL
jgi:hypothetical protein